jgi:Protein of unknown function (DUF1153)
LATLAPSDVHGVVGASADVVKMRWTALRKAHIAVGIRTGKISVAHAKKRHALSDEELAAWMHDYDAHGWPGLRSTRYQLYAQMRQPTSAAR